MEDELVQEEEEDLMSTKRIFIGGLGEKVSEEDIQKTFSSLGTIKGIQFVRTNGRSFAYLDFKPSSDKSLSKLFSSYNGCIWKGGRLRLEKAKEHYMVRLRREWEEDTELAHKENDEVDANENKDANEIKDETTKIPSSIKFLNKSKLLNLEKKQLQIFVPKLRKVKSMPYSGTGKHKYSFQRVEVPSLPIHFCDCEEHCGSSDLPKAKHTSDFEDQTGNVNDEELDMMRSVMDKILKREGNASTEISNVRVPTEEESPNQSDAPSNESEAGQDSDADNLVINIVSGGNARLHIMEKGRLKSEPNPAKHRSSSAGSTENKFKAQKEKNNVSVNFLDPISKKKPRLLPSDDSNRNEFSSTMPQMKENPENCIDESRGSIVAQPDKKISKQQFATGKTVGGQSRVQNSSWRELVREIGNSSFSISHILPDIASRRQNLQNYDSLSIVNANDSKRTSTKQFTSELTENRSNDVGNRGIVHDKVITTVSNMASSLKEKRSSGFLEGVTDKVKRNTENHKIDSSECSKSSETRNNSSLNRKAPTDVKIGEVCTFMKSEESEREWRKIIAARKKKSNEMS
ncbi:RNA-binding (RRM/RBD/RNP motifs) family protein [Thalictrum thalictroides]|uniref:RNA-binding (RRM/RBD/RNP motifs) family protein n=1 Tax=Thalictrum thalictroides TaxID=46969 RepID=A0A7J6V8U4_THATH|nr:RNA-binding (RRM/RBD/RNP motifs) family protein [Thalictrum thalictroides]